MKRTVFALFLCMTLLSSCSSKEDEIPVSSVSIDQSTAEMIVGETLQLHTTITPSNASDKTVIWTSSKQSVATVTNDGLVRAISEGTTTITAQTGGEYSRCQITVSEAVVPVMSIVLDKESITLEEGATITIVASVKPDNATDKTIAWSSFNTEIAIVDERGTVTAVKEGTTTILATVGGITATCNVIVQIAVTSITLNKTELLLEKGQSETLIASIVPNDASDKTVIWNSSDEHIAIVNDSGEVRAIAGGHACITANAGGREATCDVTVTVPATAISLNDNSIMLEEGQTATLIATILPEDATDTNIIWSSSDESVATVENGLVSAVKEGSATITVKVGNLAADCQVLVKAYDPTIIRFADPKIKDKLVAAFDMNGDNELSYEEAAAVTSGDEIKTALGAIKSYTSFDEFQFFTGVDNVVDNMFEDWAILSSIIIPNHIQRIGASSFKNCPKLASIVIPAGVMSIGAQAFTDCRDLTSITIPESVSSIGSSAFSGCSNLHIMYIKNLSSWLNTNISSWQSHPFGASHSGQIILNGEELKEVTIPDNLSAIKSYIFTGCTGITSVSISNNVSSIGERAFSYCSSLSSITIPEGVVSIGNGAFLFCESLTSITIPKGVVSIGDRAFTRSGITSIIIPKSVLTIDTYAFSYCERLYSVTLQEGISIIEGCVFEGCTSLKSIAIPESVSSIGFSAFRDCTSLTSVSIPESVTTIGERSFYGCSSLTSITIPKSVVRINYQAFIGCTGMEKVIVLATETPSGANGMFNNTNNCPIYVPAGSVEAYMAAQFWSDYADRIQAIP